MGVRPRAGRDSGAAAVEFALLLPVFLILTIGMISAGFAFERWITVTQAARETSRYGATLSIEAAQPADINGWLAQVAAVAWESSAFDASPPGARVCVSLTQTSPSTPPVTTSKQLVRTATGSVTGIEPCYVSTTAGSRVQVTIQRDTDFNMVVANPTIVVESRSQSRWEGAP